MADFENAEFIEFTNLNGNPINDTNLNRLQRLMLLNAHPIGSYYWSSENTDPSTLFGGTWVQVKDKFILAVGDTYTTVGATGGSMTKTIAKANLPDYTLYNNTHTHSMKGFTVNFGAGKTTIARSQDDAVGGPTTSNQFYLTDTVTDTANIKITSGGSGTALDITPSYETAYCWKRTA